MRELKFRAWIPKRDEMVELPFAALQYFDFEGSFALSFVVDAYDGFYAHEMYKSMSKECSKDAVIMQYTGLKDAYDVEIFEGDVVDYMRGAVQWISQVAYNPQNASFGLRGGNTTIAGVIRHFSDWDEPEHNLLPYLKVYGNIHENLDLLYQPLNQKS